MKQPRFRHLLAALACAALASAQAADPPKAGNTVKGKGSGPLLTRAELRDCMARQERVRSLTDEVLKQRDSLEKEQTEVTALRDKLKEQSAALDRTSAEAVDAYNRQVQEFDKRADAYNAATPAFNAKAETLQTEREGLAKACENRRFDELDEIAIKKGK